ncbi:MAG: conjugal transfer protein TraF [Granulosicoccus sp.]
MVSKFPQSVFQKSLIITALTVATAPALAADARSMALGGSAIANGVGVHGALENPASMLRMQREGQRLHLRIGASVEFRDSAELVDTLTSDSNENLATDIDDEVARLSGSTLTCDPLTATSDTDCLSGTELLGDLSSRVLDILNQADNETIDAQLDADLGIAFTAQAYPFAVHLHASGTVAGTPDIADGDKNYVSGFADVLSDGSLTYGELLNTLPLTVDTANQTLNVATPEEVITSTVNGSYLIRTQLGVSLGTTLAIAGTAVDFGITPKLSSLIASSDNIEISDEFDDNSPSVEDRFETNEVEDTSFTFDIGASAAINQLPIRVAAVLRNMVPESIKTGTGFEFETTPQLIVGGVYQQGMVSVTADLALNEAKIDNFETQVIAIGVEFGNRLFAIRGGISHENAREDAATALSLGAGLGPLQIGARLAGAEELQASAQLSFSF